MFDDNKRRLLVRWEYKVTEKKLIFDSKDVERLRKLLIEEESKLDALNADDNQLGQLEAELEQKFKQLHKQLPTDLSSKREQETYQRNLQQLEKRIKELPQSTDKTPEKSGQVLWFGRSPKTMAPWLGVVAAAALLMLFVRPNQNQDSVGIDSQMQFKGTGEGLAQAECELDASDETGRNLEILASGMGFLAPASRTIILSTRCSRDGFIQVLFTGAQPSELRNLPSRSGNKSQLTKDGNLIKFALQSKDDWSMNIVLTEKEVATDSDWNRLFDAVEPSSDAGILWRDQISVKVKD